MYAFIVWLRFSMAQYLNVYINTVVQKGSLVSDIVTDRVRSTRREVIVSLCQSTPSGGGGPASRRWGGTPPWVPPCWTWLRDTQRGVPHLRYPLVRPGWGVPQPGGTPTSDTPPCQTWLGIPHLGYPPSDLAGGYPDGGVPPPRVPPHQTWPGGTPPQVPPLSSDLAGGYPDGGGTPPQVTDGVLDTPRSVCLLRSRRRTFLFYIGILSTFM